MSGFFTALMHRGPRSGLSRYTEFCGLLYFVIGFVLLAVPTVPAGLLGIEFAGAEEGYIRLAGLSVGLVGYFYWFGGRTGATSFGLSTVVDRLLLPAVLIPMALSGLIEIKIALPFAILDPVLGIGAFLIWKREARADE
jgi:hypothetical protein